MKMYLWTDARRSKRLC